MHFKYETVKSEAWEIIMDLNNAMNEGAHAYDDNLYSMDDFDEIFYGWSPTNIANCIAWGVYNPSDEWFMFDGSGNIKTMNDFEVCDWMVDMLCEYSVEMIAQGRDYKQTLKWYEENIEGFDVMKVIEYELAQDDCEWLER